MKTINMIQKIVSGGQTGADLAALITAKKFDIKTGGFAPKGWKTESGSNPYLCTRYNLVETSSEDYKERTEKNVLTTDATIIFYDTYSKGSYLTKITCEKKKKPYLLISSSKWDEEKEFMMAKFIFEIYLKKKRPIFINFSGNRESKSPGIEQRVINILENLFNKSI